MRPNDAILRNLDVILQNTKSQKFLAEELHDQICIFRKTIPGMDEKRASLKAGDCLGKNIQMRDEEVVN